MGYAIDVETTGLQPHSGDRMFAYAIGHEDGTTEVYRFNKKAIKPLQEFFDDISIVKIFHNAKFDLTFIENEGVKIPEETQIQDTMIMSQLLRNLAPSHSLDYLCWELCGYPRTLDKKIQQIARALGGYDKVPIRLMEKYQGCDVERTQLLYQTFFPEIKKDKKLYQDYLNEIELIKTTMRMERHGIMVDKNNCNKLINWMQDELDDVQNQLYELMGERVNLNSSHQIIRLLYRRLRISPWEFTAGGDPSTKKSVIMKLREEHPHPLYDLILKQRSYTKGIAIVGDYLELAGEDSILHPTINTNLARTGRESGSNPNLQNVSKEQVLLNPFPVPSRKAFRAFPEHILYLVDYAGIEMRLIIDQTKEEEMMEVVKVNGDVHGLAATVLYGPIYEDLDYIKKFGWKQKTLRNAAKNCNFLIPYGGGKSQAYKTLGCELLNIDYNTFSNNFENYKKRWPRVGYFTNNVVKLVQKQGYVETPFGRKLFIPRDKAYSGSNYLIQGTAAGILKRAQVRIDKYLKKSWMDKVRLVIPIHDELILSYPRNLFKYTNIILPKISHIMVDMKEIEIQLAVEWKKTKTTWDKAEEIEVEY